MANRRMPATRRREIVAWATYDWANSAYSTLSITLLVAFIQALGREVASGSAPDGVGARRK